MALLRELISSTSDEDVRMSCSRKEYVMEDSLGDGRVEDEVRRVGRKRKSMTTTTTAEYSANTPSPPKRRVGRPRKTPEIKGNDVDEEEVVSAFTLKPRYTDDELSPPTTDRKIRPARVRTKPKRFEDMCDYDEMKDHTDSDSMIHMHKSRVTEIEIPKSSAAHENKADEEAEQHIEMARRRAIREKEIEDNLRRQQKILDSMNVPSKTVQQRKVRNIASIAPLQVSISTEYRISDTDSSTDSPSSSTNSLSPTEIGVPSALVDTFRRTDVIIAEQPLDFKNLAAKERSKQRQEEFSRILAASVARKSPSIAQPAEKRLIAVSRAIKARDVAMAEPEYRPPAPLIRVDRPLPFSGTKTVADTRASSVERMKNKTIVPKPVVQENFILSIRDIKIMHERQRMREEYIEKEKLKKLLGEGDERLQAVKMSMARHDIIGESALEKRHLNALYVVLQELQKQISNIVYDDLAYSVRRKRYLDVSAPSLFRRLDYMMRMYYTERDIDGNNVMFVLGSTLTYADYALFEMMEAHLSIDPHCLLPFEQLRAVTTAFRDELKRQFYLCDGPELLTSGLLGRGSSAMGGQLQQYSSSGGNEESFY